MKHHGAGLRLLLQKNGMAKAKIEQLLKDLQTDYRQAELSRADQVMLDYCKKLPSSPAAITAEEVVDLREVGFSDLAIHDICTVAAYFAFVNRIADGLGVELEQRFCEDSSTKHL